jgi:trans-aconitate methyltransferase
MKRCLVCENVFSSKDWKCPTCGQSPVFLDGFVCFSPDLVRTSTGFKPEFFQTLAEIEDRHFWFRSRNRLIVWALRRFFSDSGSLMEVGCGTGYVLSGLAKEFPHLNLAGSEIQTVGLSFAAERVPLAKFWQMDAGNIPFQDEFDVLVAFDVLEHIDDDQTALQQMAAAVKPGGGVLVTVPQHMFLWSQTDENACHRRRYDAKKLQQQMERAGLTLLYRTSFVSLLFPLLLWTRLRKRSAENLQDQADEFALHASVNLVLEWVMGLERIFLKCGIRFPFGGSLLMVAKKL